MKKFVRVGLAAIFIVGIIWVFYYFGFRFFPFYLFWGWGVHYFGHGPRMGPVFPFFGMLILILAGILVAKYFFQALRDSSISKKDDLIFCPYCGRDLRQGKT